MVRTTKGSDYGLNQVYTQPLSPDKGSEFKT